MLQTADSALTKRPTPTGNAGAGADDALARVRSAIDAIDDRLLDLVAERLALAREVGRIKRHRHLVRADREAALFARVEAGPLPPQVARAIWAQLIAAMLAEEGIAEMILADEALRLPALLRFGQVLPARVDADWVVHAPRHDAIVIAPAQAQPPPGCAVLLALPGGAGVVIGPERQGGAR
jgi:chorismate mutase